MKTNLRSIDSQDMSMTWKTIKSFISGSRGSSQVVLIKLGNNKTDDPETMVRA